MDAGFMKWHIVTNSVNFYIWATFYYGIRP